MQRSERTQHAETRTKPRKTNTKSSLENHREKTGYPPIMPKKKKCPIKA
jgi:hypothetical protein